MKFLYFYSIYAYTLFIHGINGEESIGINQKYKDKLIGKFIHYYII